MLYAVLTLARGLCDVVSLSSSFSSCSRVYAIGAVNAEEPLPDDFVPINYGVDPEKIAFPLDDRTALTFSTAFGQGQEVLPPSQMFAPRLWETFSTHDDSPSVVETVQLPSAALSKQPSSRSYNTVERHDSKSSTHSSISTSSRGGDSLVGHSKRWVIE